MARSVSQIVEAIGDDQDHLLALLQTLQHEYGYLETGALRQLSELTGISLKEITATASFYSTFRWRPRGKYLIEVCIGAACHVKGATEVYESFRRVLGLAAAEDTDRDGVFTLQKVACLGCCMLAPAVRIGSKIYAWCEPRECASMLEDFLANVRRGHDVAGHVIPGDIEGEINLCLCSSCAAAGSRELYEDIARELKNGHFRVRLREVGCSGMSFQAPLLTVRNRDGISYQYGKMDRSKLLAVLANHFTPGRPSAQVKSRLRRALDAFYRSKELLPCSGDRMAADAFGANQLRIVTEFSHELAPLSLTEYQAKDGFAALTLALGGQAAVLDELRLSGLRGRGGGGFPTARKWELLLHAPGETKYLVCNADEGDPGAFMDRMLLESFPFRVLEGMMIAAATLPVRTGIIYIRLEYQRAIEMLQSALAVLHEAKMLPMANGFDITVFTGAGAFVCGEETALIASMAGRRGTPRRRPPFPVERGFHDCPTLINNVETFAAVPWIVRHGGAAFRQIGTASSPGTKTFALAGKIRHGGLIEVPMGMTIRRILEDIGGGAEPKRQLKAVQIGGPSGGCIPEKLFDFKVDFDELQQLGGIMGSGGLVALDDLDCMVDIAAYFLRFTANESCGKCVFCRNGSQRMLAILEQIREGKGKMADLAELRELGEAVKQGSLCGLGRTAPNPALSALTHFYDEFVEHIHGRCPAGKCVKLTVFEIGSECNGCTLCAQNCAAGAIAFTPYERHVIDQSKCVKCGVCRNLCPQGAVGVKV